MTTDPRTTDPRTRPRRGHVAFGLLLIAFGLFMLAERTLGLPAEPRVDKEFSSRFEDARFHLPDAEYQAFIKFEVAPVTQVNDYIKNTSHRVEKDGAITDLGHAYKFKVD